MQHDETDLDGLLKSLTDNFNVLADDVQLLSDRKTILEHKLRFAHEQYQHLADKYAPSDSEISITLAKLQLPPELKLHSHERATFVPLPSRRPAGSKQQIAEAIRDGRRASQKLASLRGWRGISDAGNRSTSGTSESAVRTSRRGTSATTVFEQDFTVPGKKSQLLCPFTKMASKPEEPYLDKTIRLAFDPTSGPDPSSGQQITPPGSKAPTHAPSTDPICAALYSEARPSPPASATGSAAKCPIRYLDQHSAEDVAKYFEIHKHEIPRSHEVCVKRYQRNEEDIRKLDAKYGNLVSMISGLGQKHQPMLQNKDEEHDNFDEGRSDDRVKNWAKKISADEVEGADVKSPDMAGDQDREGHFDRPMREIRVGESPSRPWGISVPFVDQLEIQDEKEKTTAIFPKAIVEPQPSKATGKCPFPHASKTKETEQVEPEAELQATRPFDYGRKTIGNERPKVKPNPLQEDRPQPAFIQSAELKNLAGGGPQVVFTGPVFIGYPVEQAMALMQQWQAGTSSSGPL